MSQCSHNCDSCGESCSLWKKPDAVKKVIGIVSGKGGVGKSMTTSLLSVLTQRSGKQTAILDADITGPSIPKMFGLTEKAVATDKGILPVLTKTEIQVMSINLLLQNDTDPVIWRGPVITGVVKQFWQDVLWSKTDVMFIDMPPGTGDVPLTVFQSIPLDGIIVMTSPQDLVSMIVQKAVQMASLMEVPILGLIENMSYVKCEDCGKEIKVFGESHIDEIAQKHGLKILGKLPLDPNLARLCDAGKIEEISQTLLADAVQAIADI